jgi:hypothetical protein
MDAPPIEVLEDLMRVGVRKSRLPAALLHIERPGAEDAALRRKSLSARQSRRALTACQQSNTDQQMSFLSRWSSRTSSRIASGN